jgi:RimJ/RimL family protein N-acetyltransferase
VSGRASTGADLLISTRRLDLHTVLPEEYRILQHDRADPRLWSDRGFANPLGHLVDDPGPLPYRIPRVEEDPDAAPYLLRLAVLRERAIVIGSAGFHARPDADGMIEIGLGIAPEERGRGFAQEVLRGMWGWVVAKPEVRTLRYTVSPDNAPSQAIIRTFGFDHVGQQLDEIDGPEDIYELSAEEYRRRFPA